MGENWASQRGFYGRPAERRFCRRSFCLGETYHSSAERATPEAVAGAKCSTFFSLTTASATFFSFEFWRRDSIERVPKEQEKIPTKKATGGRSIAFQTKGIPESGWSVTGAGNCEIGRGSEEMKIVVSM